MAVLGALLGLAADRLAARWPEHEEAVPSRGVGWRTAVVILVGALAFAALAARWLPSAGESLVPFLVLAAYFAALLLLLATDLDQRLLPDLVTLPLAASAATLLVAGANPLLAGKTEPFVSAVLAGVAAPAFLAVTSILFRGGVGMGDIKLAAGLGLFCGASRLFVGLLAGSLLFSMAVLGLVVARRIGLRTVIPFGPALILGGMVAALVG